MVKEILRIAAGLSRESEAGRNGKKAKKIRAPAGSAVRSWPGEAILRSPPQRRKTGFVTDAAGYGHLALEIARATGAS
jgi:hypothetical protein